MEKLFAHIIIKPLSHFDSQIT